MKAIHSFCWRSAFSYYYY